MGPDFSTDSTLTTRFVNVSKVISQAEDSSHRRATFDRESVGGARTRRVSTLHQSRPKTNDSVDLARPIGCPSPVRFDPANLPERAGED